MRTYGLNSFRGRSPLGSSVYDAQRFGQVGEMA